METSLTNILVPALLAFVIGIAITPIVTHFLYKHKVWKKTGGKTALNGDEAKVFNELKGKDEHKTPRMGGIVIWGSVLLTLLVTLLLTIFFSNPFIEQLGFLSRSQTLIPVVAMMIGAGIGFLNDFYDITHDGKGLRLSIRLLLIIILSSMSYIINHIENEGKYTNKNRKNSWS